MEASLNPATKSSEAMFQRCLVEHCDDEQRQIERFNQLSTMLNIRRSNFQGMLYKLQTKEIKVIEKEQVTTFSNSSVFSGHPVELLKRPTNADCNSLPEQRHVTRSLTYKRGVLYAVCLECCCIRDIRNPFEDLRVSERERERDDRATDSDKRACTEALNYFFIAKTESQPRHRIYALLKKFTAKTCLNEKFGEMYSDSSSFPFFSCSTSS